MSELFLEILNMSISASWLVLAVLILRLVLKKAPKWTSVLLLGYRSSSITLPIFHRKLCFSDSGFYWNR